MLEAYEDASHEGNSERYHTGKECIESGCNKPAGTRWGPHWCFEHNRDRIRRIGASLDNALQRAEFNARVREATESAWDYGHKMHGYLKAAVMASGGSLTIKNSDVERPATYESTSYSKTTTTFRFGKE